MSVKLKLSYLEKIDERGNLQVWIVDGSYIRGHIDEEFTNFGQHYSFPLFPKTSSGLKRKPKTMNGSFSSTICWWSTGSWRKVYPMTRP